MKLPDGFPYVIAELKGLQIAVSTRHVAELLRVPRWHEVPNTPCYVRGVINLRGKVLPLVDLRMRLGLPSFLDDVTAMTDMLSAREQDHVLWLRELLAAVSEGRPFKLARDPAECAFGKWYYSYKPDDIGFASVMHRFEAPHRRIHGIADTALNYAAVGDLVRAKELVHSTERGDLQAVIKLFEEARTAYRESSKEVAMVLTDGRKQVSITLDRVAAVEPLAENTIEDATPEMGARSGLLQKVAHRSKGGQVAFLLDVEALLSGQGQAQPVPGP